MPVYIDVPVKGFNVFLCFNVHLEGLLGVIKRVVGTGGKLSVRAFRKNEVNVGLHILFSFYLLKYKNYAKVGLFIEKYCDKMRNLRLYNTDAAFKAHEQASGGDGLSTESVVPGVSMSKDQSKRYFNPKDKTVLYKTVYVTSKIKDTDLVLDYKEPFSFKTISGVNENVLTVYGKCPFGFIQGSEIVNFTGNNNEVAVECIPDTKKYTVALYKTTYNNQRINILRANQSSNLSKIIIDGVEVSNTTTYTNFYSAGTHVVLFEHKEGKTTLPYCLFSGITELNMIFLWDNITSIDKYCFYNCANLSKIILSKKLTSIGSYAFSLSRHLTNIDIPSGVIQMQDWAFCETSINSITIPDGVTEISYGCFAQCTSLTSVTMSKNIKIINSYAFKWCPITSFVIPDGVTHIYDYAFSGCTALSSITMPNTLTYLGGGAFSSCFSLKELNIPYGVTTISIRCFADCTSLTDITIPDSVKVLGDSYSSAGYCFGGCSSLTSITLGTGITTIYGDNIFRGVVLLKTNFINNSSFDEVEHNYWGATVCDNIVNNVLYIKDTTAVKCLNKEEVTAFTIPNTITTISGSCFANCTNLVSVSIPNSVVNIGAASFGGCSNLSSITIPDSVTGIGDSVFYNCTNLKEVSIGSGITNLPSACFYKATSLSSITIPNNIENIGEMCFYECSKLENIILGNNITSIGGSCFMNCNNLTGITIPDSVTTIGNSAFERSGLRSVVLGNSLTAISNNCFSVCSGLTSITIPDSVTTIGSYAFSSCLNLGPITIPDSVKKLDSYCFSGCTGLTAITIGSGMTSISGFCFANSYLKSITIRAVTAPTIVKTTFRYILNNGKLYYPAGSSYSSWMQSNAYYLGYAGWTSDTI